MDSPSAVPDESYEAGPLIDSGPSSADATLSHCDSWSVINSDERKYYAQVEDPGADGVQSQASAPMNFSDSAEHMPVEVPRLPSG